MNDKNTCRSMLSKNKLGKTQARAKRNNMITKNKLLNLIADLIETLLEYDCDSDNLVETLKYYGFTKKQIADWYGLEHNGETND